MPNAAQVNFKVTNLTQSISSPLQGVNFVMGRSIAGPFADPSEIFNSWVRFVSVHGGLSTDSDAPFLVKRLLEKGGSVRFCRVGHYTDIGDSSTLDAEKASQQTLTILEFSDVVIAGDEISVTVNGDAITPIPFNTDHNDTVGDLIDSLLLHSDVSSVTPIMVGGNILQLVIRPTSGQTITLTALDITGADPADLTTEQITKIVNYEGEELFSLVPKYEGSSFNSLVITVAPGSNGQTGYFDIQLTSLEDPLINEYYQNLRITGTPTAGDSTYLSTISENSQYLDVVYSDLSAIVGSAIPIPMIFNFTGGTNGTAPSVDDYIGDSGSKTGLHAFDEYNDSMQLVVLDNDSDEVNVAASAYAHNRKDLIYLLELPSTLGTKAAHITKRESLNINSKFTYIFGGGIKLRDPLAGITKNFKAIADVLANIAATDKDFGEWYSFAGPNRGNITGALGVVNNFGAPANFKDLNDLANRQINMVINRDNSIKLWGNHSAQYDYDQESQISIVRLIIFLQKSLRPTLERFLEEPCDIPTWKRIYFTVKPFLDGLVTARALFSYEWQGDQDATSLNNLQVNNPTDVGLGKYKVNFIIKAIPSIQEINVNIILSPAGIEFETVSELL